MSVTLIEYSREIGPKIRELLRKKEILGEWKKDDEQVAEYQQEIKNMQETLKGYIEDSESDLVREIQALETDIKLAVKAASKGTAYKAPDLKAFLFARAKENVDKTVEKGELFVQLTQELK